MISIRDEAEAAQSRKAEYRAAFEAGVAKMTATVERILGRSLTDSERSLVTLAATEVVIIGADVARGWT